MVAETSSSQRVRFRADAVCAAPGRPSLTSTYGPLTCDYRFNAVLVASSCIRGSTPVGECPRPIRAQGGPALAGSVGLPFAGQQPCKEDIPPNRSRTMVSIVVRICWAAVTAVADVLTGAQNCPPVAGALGLGVEPDLLRVGGRRAPRSPVRRWRPSPTATARLHRQLG